MVCGFAKEKLVAKRFQRERNNLVFWVACFVPLDIFSDTCLASG